MAASTRRSVGIFIDGQQAAKSLKDIIKEAEGLRSALAQTTEGTDAFVKKSLELQRVEKEVATLSGEYDKLEKAGKTLDSLAARQKELSKALQGDLGSEQRAKLLKELAEVNADFAKMQRLLNGVQSTGEPSLRELEAAFKSLSREVKNTSTSAADYGAKVQRLQALQGEIDTHRKSIVGVESSWQEVATGATRFLGIAGIAFGAEQVVQYGKQLYQTGVEMDTLGRKAETVLGEALNSVSAAARESAAAMGLTNAQYVAAVTNIADLLKPMGFTTEEAARQAVEIQNLSGVLSEWSGGKFGAVETSESLRKALLGEREELERYGVSIKQSEVNARLAEQGFDKLTGQALRQAEAMATLQLVTEKSSDAIRSYETNSDSAARRQAELSARIADIGERLAVALLPAFERLVVVAGNVVGVIGDVADYLGQAEDPARSLTDQFNQQAAKVRALEAELPKLLDRYEELKGKSSLTKAEQNELAGVIQRISELTPTAITQVDNYGKALDINASASRAFLEAEQARLRFVNKESISALEQQIKKTEQLRDATKQLIEAGGKETLTNLSKEGSKIEFVRLSAKEITDLQAKLKQLTTDIIGAEQELKRQRGEPLAVAGKPASGAAPGADLEAEARRQAAADARKKAAEEAAEDRKQEAERELEDQRRKSEALLDAISKYQQDARLLGLSAAERRLEEIRLSYQDEIDQAIALEASKNQQVAQAATAQKAELLRLQSEALEAERQKISEEETSALLDRLTAQNEAQLEADEKFKEDKQEIHDEIKQLGDELFEAETEEELTKLQEKYDALLELAKAYGVDLSDIQKAQAERRVKQAEEVAQQLKDQEQKLFQAQKDVQLAKINLYRTVAEQIGQIIGDNAAITEAIFLFEKVAAVAEIIIQGQKERSAIRFQYAALKAQAATTAITAPLIPGFEALQQAELARSKINTATSIAGVLGTTIARYVQKKEGGFATVRGADDGQIYQARLIGQPETGVLDYPHPVLTNSGILANEVGREYYVSHSDLRNPKVLNHVRAIENIVTHRQMATGGFAPTTPGAPSGFAPVAPGAPSGQAPPPAPENQRLLAVLDLHVQVLQELMRRGVHVQLDDNTLIAMQKRMNQIVSASGGRVF